MLATKGDGPCTAGPRRNRNAKRFPRKGEQTERGNHPVDGSPERICGPPGGAAPQTEFPKKAACSYQSSMIRNTQNRICPETAAYPVLFCPAAIPLSAPIAPGIPGLREKVGQQRYILFSLTSAAIFKIRIWVLPSGISLSITICTALSSGMRSTSRNSSSSGSISP